MMHIFGGRRWPGLVARLESLVLPEIPDAIRDEYEMFCLEQMRARILLFLNMGSVVFVLYSLVSFIVIPDMWKVDVIGRLTAVMIVPIANMIIRRAGRPEIEIVAGITTLVSSIWLCTVSGMSNAPAANLSMTSNILVIIYLITLLNLSLVWALTFSVAAMAVQVVATSLSGFVTAGHLTSMMAVSLSTIGSLIFFNIKLEAERRQVFVLKHRDRDRIDRLDRLSGTDPLTGLGNRRTLDSIVAAEGEGEARLSRHQVMILDVDHFKAFNDTYGHATGDEVLRAISVAIRGACRADDTACRYGGEEFAVLGPPTHGVDSLAEAAERIRAAVGEIRIPDPKTGDPIKVTVSIGCASSGHGITRSRAVELADRALYRAKAEGRDRVVVAGPREHDAAI